MKYLLTFLFLSLVAHATNHDPHVLETKEEVIQKKTYPDLVFMSKVLIPTALVFFLPTLHKHTDPADEKICERFRQRQELLGMILASIACYYIGKKYYPHQDSSYKNLFSRTLLAQKIFNI